MRVVDGPRRCRKAVLVMADNDGAVQRLLCRIADLAVDEENLLVNLKLESALLFMRLFLRPYPGVIRDGDNSWGKR